MKITHSLTGVLAATATAGTLLGAGAIPAQAAVSGPAAPARPGPMATT